MKLTVDFEKALGRIKPMHGVDAPPKRGIDCSFFKYLSDAAIPYSRLHDVAPMSCSSAGRVVDIADIFRKTADNEMAHAKLWSAELGKIGGTAL